MGESARSLAGHSGDSGEARVPCTRRGGRSRAGAARMISSSMIIAGMIIMLRPNFHQPEFLPVRFLVLATGQGRGEMRGIRTAD
jgi:hypothetical protein